MNITKSDFWYQIIALLLAFIVVHTIYVGLIRPNAQIVLEAEKNIIAEQQITGKTAPIKRSFWVVLKDYEQESCFILMLWAIAIMFMKYRHVGAQKKLLDKKLIHLEQSGRILPEDVRLLSRPIDALPLPERQYLLAKVLRSALIRFGSNGSINDVSSVVKEACDTEANRLDAELSMVRYIAWAIPSIGFIGTVRGIGEALGNAHEAIGGNIASVTSSLGVAFNSTFIALLISIVIMFLTHQITLLQERMVLATQDYCDEKLIPHLDTGAR